MRRLGRRASHLCCFHAAQPDPAQRTDFIHVGTVGATDMAMKARIRPNLSNRYPIIARNLLPRSKGILKALDQGEARLRGWCV